MGHLRLRRAKADKFNVNVTWKLYALYTYPEMQSTVEYQKNMVEWIDRKNPLWEVYKKSKLLEGMRIIEISAHEDCFSPLSLPPYKPSKDFTS